MTAPGTASGAASTHATGARRELDNQMREHFDHTMAALARFSGGIAHDFNNVLTIIFGYTNFLLERVHKEGPLYAQLSEIKQAGERAGELTRLLMIFGAQRVFQPQVMNVNAVISTCEQRLAAAAGGRVRLVLRLCEERCLAALEPYEFERALLCLADNAREAMPDGGTLTITTSIRSDAAGGQVIVCVQDSGPGFSDEALEHVCEPFFSTKHDACNNGLGLFTVYAVVRQCGGTVTCRNAPGGGAEITFALPRARVPQPAAKTARPAAPAPGREGSTVLIVEDDQRVRAVLKEALSLKGFGVLEAGDGVTALQVLAQHPARVDVLLTDVVMPEMNGHELGARVLAMRPDMKIMYMSGFSDDQDLRTDVLQQKSLFIQKPFTPQQLIQKLREVLAG